MRALITTDTVGGVWTFTEELTGQLLARGWTIQLVSLGAAPSQSQQAWCDRLEVAYQGSFHHEALVTPLEWMPENHRAWPEAAPLLVKMAAEFGADILHANQFCFGALPVDVPIVLTAHSDVLSWARACGKRLEDTAWLRTYCGLVTRGLTGAADVVAPTRWMADSLQRDFLLPQSPVVIPNGRSLPTAQPVGRRLQAVVAGRLWDEAKNIAMLADVQAPMELLIAGESAPGFAAAPPLPPNVHCLGPLAPENLHALFRKSALYICTSRYEPFGLAALEAAQCGCAILANDIPSLREVWQDAALYFRDASSLTALLHHLRGDLRGLEAAQARAAARAHLFSAERMGSAYHNLFLRLITRPEQEAELCQAVSA